MSDLSAHLEVHAFDCDQSRNSREMRFQSYASERPERAANRDYRVVGCELAEDEFGRMMIRLDGYGHGLP